MDGATNEATVGVEDGLGVDGLQVAFNTSYIENNLAIDITSVPDFITDVSPASGSLASGSSDDITVTLDATEVPAGDYENTLALASNDPDASTEAIPFSVSVTAGPPEIDVDPAELAFDPTIENGSATAALTVNNTGGEALEVTGITTGGDAFSVDAETPITIGFDDAPVSIPVTFSPSSSGAISGTLTIESNAGNTPELTVPLSGEGLVAPEIAADPDAFDVTVDLGETLDRTLTVSNAADPEAEALEFGASFVMNGEDMDPAMVAAPFEGNAKSNSPSGAFTSERPIGKASEVPFQASDFVYQLDDGSSENALGAGGGDILWINAFEVVDGATNIASIASAFGSSQATGLPGGSPVEFLVYDDPNNDGDPSDAVLLERVEATSQNPHTDEFQVVNIDPTAVEGTFFIGVVYRDYEDGQFPAPIDESSDPQGASWIVADAQGVNEEDLGDNALGPDNLDDIGFPGNWLLRADGGEQIVAVSPDEGTVDPGSSQDLTVTFDGTSADPGMYDGSIRLVSNDFANSPLDIPVELFIDAGPPQIVLDPRTLEFEDRLVGGTGTQTFEITNLGSDTLQVSSITSTADDFVPLTTSVPELAYAESAEVEVEFAPSETGVRVGTIAIESNAEEKPTAEVAVVGEGFAAPEIAADPESFDVTVPFGEDETLEETLLVSNAGAGELEYEIDIVGGAANLAPSAVAAPFEGDMEQPTADSPFKSAHGSNSGLASPAPYQASEFVYQLDDGSSEDALGAGGGEIMWINAFETVEEAVTINSIASAWAASTADGFPEGGDAEFLLYNDPNNDGDPSDAELITSVSTTVQAPHTDEFTVEEISPTSVEGVFFVAAVVGYEDGQFPAPLDEGSSQGASWIVGGGSVDTGDLSNNELGPDNIDALGFPGNWLLRADGFTEIEGEPGVRPLPADAVTVEPSEGTVTPGGEQELAITFNGNVDPGPYTGSIRILNNDPLQSVLDVPVDLLVDAGPPEIALNPESLTFDDLLVGNSNTLTFEISNAGGNPLIIDSVASDSEDFIVEDDLAFDVREDTVDVSVTFAPTAVGSRSGTITLQTNIGEDETVTLPVEGEGLEPPALALNPEVLQSVQQPDTQEQVELTVANNGESGSTLEYSFPTFAAQNVLSQPGVEPNNTSRVFGTRSFEKGEEPHAGQGHPVQLGAGGPDNFGYRWIDSNEFGGPSFEWVDISEDGEELENITDDFVGTPSVEVELPFEFPFYGDTKTSVRVDNNGFLFFDSPSGNYFINQEIPTAGAPDGMVAPFWTDLNPDAGGAIYVYDDSENDRFIVQYDEVPPFVFGETEDSYTFQVILTADGMIRYQYLNMDGAVNGATVGIENADGSDGLQTAFNTNYIENNLAVDVAFVPQFITDVEPATGSINSGDSEPVQVTFDSEGLDVGVYGQEGPFGLGVSTNDPRATFGYTSAVLSVVGENGPQIANAPADQQLTLGGDALELDLNDVFSDPLGEGLDIEVEATNPLIVDTEVSDNTLTVTPTGAGTSRVEMRAVNADGQVQANFVVTVGQLAVDVTRDFGGQAADATNYRLVALPGAISLPMGDIMEGEAGLDWQAFWDNGGDSDPLVQYDGSETFTFEPGRGFWLTGQEAWEHQGEHSAIELDRPDGQVTIPLHDGWNIISNPMGINRDLVNLEAINGESLNPFWSFNGSFSADSTLTSAMSGEAYYFLNDGGLDELTLQLGEEQPEPPSTTAEATSSTDPLISVSATLVDRSEVTSTVQLGVTESSTTAASIVGPPSDFEAVSLRIQPTEGMVQADGERPPLMRAQRTLEGEGETFDLTLRTRSESPIEIRVSDLMALNGREAALLHPEAGATYDLRTNEVVTIEPTSDETTLRVAIGTSAYVQGEVDAVLPTEVTLMAYPNPVQSQATVQYTLTEAEDVRFEVYDMLGRRVATLTNERKQAGVHEMQFDANGLASGVYFGRLHVGSQTLTQKITVVR